MSFEGNPSQVIDDVADKASEYAESNRAISAEEKEYNQALDDVYYNRQILREFGKAEGNSDEETPKQQALAQAIKYVAYEYQDMGITEDMIREWIYSDEIEGQEQVATEDQSEEEIILSDLDQKKLINQFKEKIGIPNLNDMQVIQLIDVLSENNVPLNNIVDHIKQLQQMDLFDEFLSSSSGKQITDFLILAILAYENHENASGFIRQYLKIDAKYNEGMVGLMNGIEQDSEKIEQLSQEKSNLRNRPDSEGDFSTDALYLEIKINKLSCSLNRKQQTLLHGKIVYELSMGYLSKIPPVDPMSNLTVASLHSIESADSVDQYRILADNFNIPIPLNIGVLINLEVDLLTYEQKLNNNTELYDAPTREGDAGHRKLIVLNEFSRTGKYIDENGDGKERNILLEHYAQEALNLSDIQSEIENKIHDDIGFAMNVFNKYGSFQDVPSDKKPLIRAKLQTLLISVNLAYSNAAKYNNLHHVFNLLNFDFSEAETTPAMNKSLKHARTIIGLEQKFMNKKQSLVNVNDQQFMPDVMNGIMIHEGNNIQGKIDDNVAVVNRRINLYEDSMFAIQNGQMDSGSDALTFIPLLYPKAIVCCEKLLDSCVDGRRSLLQTKTTIEELLNDDTVFHDNKALDALRRDILGKKLKGITAILEDKKSVFSIIGIERQKTALAAIKEQHSDFLNADFAKKVILTTASVAIMVSGMAAAQGTLFLLAKLGVSGVVANAGSVVVASAATAVTSRITTDITNDLEITDENIDWSSEMILEDTVIGSVASVITLGFNKGGGTMLKGLIKKPIHGIKQKDSVVKNALRAVKDYNMENSLSSTNTDT